MREKKKKKIKKRRMKKVGLSHNLAAIRNCRIDRTRAGGPWDLKGIKDCDVNALITLMF